MSNAPEKTRETDKQDQKIDPPPLFGVRVHNDDFTPQDFVEQVLIQMLGCSESEAFSVMKKAEEEGNAVAKILPKDIAETKSAEINYISQKAEHPLISDIVPMGR